MIETRRWKEIAGNSWAQAGLSAVILLSILLLAGQQKALDSGRWDKGILLVEFVDDTATPGLAARLNVVLRLSLVDSPNLKLYPEREIQDSLRQMVLNPFAPLTPDVARSICLRENLKALLLPRVSWNNGEYIATIRLVEIGKTDVVPSWADMLRAGDEASLVPAVEDMARRIRVAFGEAQERLSRTSLFSGSPDDPSALQAFSQAALSIGRGDIADAIARLEHAVRVAPEFVLAHQQLASLYSGIGWTAPALAHARSAEQLADRLPRRNQLLISGISAMLRQDSSAALRHFRQLTTISPVSWEACTWLGDAAVASGDIESGIDAYRQACSVTSSQPEPYLRLCTAQLMAGDVQASRDALGRAIALAPEAAEVAAAAGWVELADGNSAAASRLFQKAAESDDPVTRSRVTLMQAQTDLFSGRTRSALRILEKGLEEDRRLGYPILEVDKRLTKAALYLLVGDKAAAAAECRLVPLLEADNPRLMFLGEILARSGTMEAAALVADRIEKAKSSSLSAFYASVVRGEIELASGRATEAIRIAQAAAKTHPGTAVRELLARSYAASGHFDQAEAEYRSLSERRGEVLFPTDRLWFSPRWPEVLFGYADCLRRQGRNQDARQQFRSFLWAFDGADPEIPRIAEARSFLRKPR